MPYGIVERSLTIRKKPIMRVECGTLPRYEVLNQSTLTATQDRQPVRVLRWYKVRKG